MPLVPLTEVLYQASRGGYAVGAFNCHNMEVVQSIVRAAEAEQAPVIIQASQGAIRYAGLEYITSLVKQAVREVTVPVVLHLDHGTSLEQVVQCIRYGFTSVMIDGSKLPLQENIELTAEAVRIARAVGVSVEAEIGKIGGTEDDISVQESEAFLTDPEEARRFAEETKVDALAIAIGTAHGQYKGEPKLDFDRLEKINRLVACPLVLHGSSGVPDESLNRAIQLGIRKINIDTNIREAFVGAVREVLELNPEEIDPRNILGPAREAAEKIIREKIKVFGSSKKA
ncbi:MAG TPA: class II fructose-1,6-bisphosphate aldolase [Firmicutes bacterium]|nr:class II fructose-1,6-bisphosphate aldolase [Bacillota bacterium]